MRFNRLWKVGHRLPKLNDLFCSDINLSSVFLFWYRKFATHIDSVHYCKTIRPPSPLRARKASSQAGITKFSPGYESSRTKCPACAQTRHTGHRVSKDLVQAIAEEVLLVQSWCCRKNEVKPIGKLESPLSDCCFTTFAGAIPYVFEKSLFFVIFLSSF